MGRAAPGRGVDRPTSSPRTARAASRRFKIPRYWKLVDEFPMTVTGKVQKFRMREIAVAELGPRARGRHAHGLTGCRRRLGCQRSVRRGCRMTRHEERRRERRGVRHTSARRHLGRRAGPTAEAAPRARAAGGLSGFVLFDADYIRYFTGFCFLSTERPVVFAQSVAGDMAVLVPEFEVARVRAETAFERIEPYPEYPGVEHPMRDTRPAPARARRARRHRRRPGRLSGHPGLSGSGAQRGGDERRDTPRGRDRGDDGAQEPGRDRADS